MARSRKRKRTIFAPAPIGRGAVNRIQSVVVAEDQDVIREWTRTPDGAQFVSGYTLVPRLLWPTRDSPLVPLDLGSSGA